MVRSPVCDAAAVVDLEAAVGFGELVERAIARDESLSECRHGLSSALLIHYGPLGAFDPPLADAFFFSNN